MYELEAKIFPQFQAIVAQSLRIDADRATMEARLNELGAESLDMIEITMECETVFNVWLPEKTILDTAEEFLGPGTLVKDGFLTTQGKQILAERLRPEEAALLEGDVPVEAVHRHFLKVGTWVSMLANLVAHTPENCAACNGLLRPATGFRLRCRDCAKEVTLRSGEEINREWLQRYYESRAASPAPEPAAATLRQSA